MDARPQRVVVEPTNNCNLNCPFCLVGLQNSGATDHASLPREFGYMDFDRYGRLLDDCAAFGIRLVQLHFQGEPFLHPRAIDMVEAAKDRGLACQLFTNGLPLTSARIKRLGTIPIDLVRFSIDGATQETYEKNRVGGRLDRALTNMKQLASARHPATRIEWQYIALKNNEHEIDEARAMARSIGVDFFVKTYAPTVDDLAPDNPAYRRRFKSKPCTDIHYQLCVFWNGDVVPCCFDVDGKEVMGNCFERSLEEIWDSDRYRRWRGRVDAADDADIEICRNCLRWR